MGVRVARFINPTRPEEGFEWYAASHWPYFLSDHHQTANDKVDPLVKPMDKNTKEWSSKTNSGHEKKKAEPLDKDPSAWTVEAVQGFLDHAGLSELQSTFLLQQIDGLVLLSLTPEDLKHELGISQFGVRRRLLLTIETLKQRGIDNQTM